MRTSHGHHIEGTSFDTSPGFVVNCGAPLFCATCAGEVEMTRRQGFVTNVVNNDDNTLTGDGRRSLTDEEIRNRFGYHKGTAVTAPMHQFVRGEFAQFAQMLDRLLVPGRAKDLALTELENAAMWANKAVAEMAPVVDE